MYKKNKTVLRSMDILNLFLVHDRLTVNEMMQLSGIPKSSVHRMLGSLSDMGFLQKNEQGQYSLGLLFLQFGNLVAERLDIRGVALPVMQRLKEEVGEAVHLAVRDGDASMYIEKLDTDHPVRLYTKIGKRALLYAGASSRTILAHLSEQEREAYLSTVELIPIGRGTITDPAVLREKLAECRSTGYSFSHSELENYTAELSAPIFDHTGAMIAGLSIAGPEERFSQERLPLLIDKTKMAARDISRRLGHDG